MLFLGENFCRHTFDPLLGPAWAETTIIPESYYLFSCFPGKARKCSGSLFIITLLYDIAQHLHPILTHDPEILRLIASSSSSICRRRSPCRRGTSLV